MKQKKDNVQKLILISCFPLISKASSKKLADFNVLYVNCQLLFVHHQNIFVFILPNNMLSVFFFQNKERL